MRPVNDDMDELYRRAADDYPLNTNSTDWNAVLKKLNADDAERKIAAAPAEKNDRRKFLWLLFLLPLGLGVYFYNNISSQPTINNAVKSSAAPITESVSSSENNPGTVNGRSDQSLANTTQPIAISTNTPQQQKTDVVKRRINGKLNTVITQDNDIVNNTNSSANMAEKENKKEPATIIQQVNNDVKESKQEIITSPQDKETEKSNVNTAINPKKISKQKSRGLYAGVVVSPDLSTIKFQSIKNAGYSAGVLLGYRFNKKLSVESGAIWSTKKYYSDGKYFSTKKLTMPANRSIVEVEGQCKMIEIPLTVKYDLRSKSKTHLSVSAGVSSYIMKKENYDYEVLRTGQQNPYPYAATYKNTTTYIPAVVNIAPALNLRVKALDLRIEPYAKIPMKGVGIGSLPIMSTGVNFVITKKLTR